MRLVHTANSRAAKQPASRKSAVRRDSLASAHPAVSAALHSSVLVLNRLYMAVHVIGVRRAFALLCRELAEVIHSGDEGVFANYTFESWLEASQSRAHQKQSHEDWIRSVNFEIQVPRVIRLLRYDRLPKHGVHLNRRNVLGPRRAPVPVLRTASADPPIEPRSRPAAEPRRTDDLGEYRLRLSRLQRQEGGRTPHEAKMKLVRKPAKPKRNPMLALKLENPKYESWRTWLDGVCWEIGAHD